MVHPRVAVRRPLKLAAAAAVALLAAAGCGSEAVPFHENPVAVLKQNSLQRSWFVDLKLSGADRQVVSLDVRPTLLFVTTADHRVTAIDRKSGVVKYTLQVRTPEDRLQPPVELNGYVVFANAINLEVFDDGGNFIRRVPVPTPIRSLASGESNDAPNVNRRTTVYFGAAGTENHGGLVEAYDVGNPNSAFKWDYITHDQGAILAAPAVFGDVVYSGDDRGEVDAVNTNRDQVWDTAHGIFMTGGAITADLRADESGLYVASTDTKLSCIDRTSGKLKWQYFNAAALTVAPVLTSDTVYLMTSNHGLVAIDKTTGPYNRPARWTCADADQFLAQDAKFAYVAKSRPDADPDRPRERFVVALDKQTGRPVFTSEHRDFTVFGTNAKDALVYVGFADGKLMALSPVLRAGQIGELVMGPVRPETLAAAPRTAAVASNN